MLPDHLIQELRYIEVYTGRRIPNLRVGTYQTRLRGSGFDFDEHRAYRPGDDVRRIDWNVTARLDAPFVRETHAERELNLTIAVDVSPSMAFGTARHSKRELSLLAAACLVFSALSDQVNVGFLAFADRVLRYHPARGARARAWSLLDEVWSLEPGRGDTALLPCQLEGLDALVPRLTVVRVPDAGHFVPWEAPDAVNRAIRDWLERVAMLLHRGEVLILDYADEADGLTRRGHHEWLRTYAAHDRGSTALEAPGTQDITCDVPLDYFRWAATRGGFAITGETTQAEWLRELGIDDLVAEGAAVWEARAAKGDLEAIAGRSRAVEADALTDPSGLGAHRVITLERRIA